MKKRRFQVIIERDEDGFFSASVPALPGCHTQAKTLPELARRVREAIMLCREMVVADKRYKRHSDEFGYEPSFVGVETVEV